MNKPIVLYILDYPGAMQSAVYGLTDILTIANNQSNKKIFSVKRLETLGDPIDDERVLLFLPPYLTNEFPEFNDSKLLASLNKWYQNDAILMSVCGGVFWLANAGLLSGRRVATHWLFCQRLEDEHPEISEVSRHEMFIDQDNIITAAGLYAFQDLALHIIARYAGYDLAKMVADFCLLDLKGRLQAYYERFYPDLKHNDELMLKAQQFCAKNLFSNVSTIEIAKHCELSERTLLRRFKQITGYSPKQYIIQLKVEKAKQLMELELNTIEEISYKIGYTDASNFIKIFKKVTGVTPAVFRTRQAS